MQTEALKKTALNALDNLKAIDITEIDVREMTSVTDVMIIASGTSGRHVKSIADAVVMACKKNGVAPLGVEGEGEGEWVLVDLGDVVVHVMQPRIREFYALEKLWSVTEENRERESGDSA
ncbi:Ribosomal silencing factor RsfA [hydrothermal vent metagenome]|uniref:Ribosomal silencing factor RsfA n=1 Tax=hydrothermal vent metagenome TaxID=652676 RepID=A0A3B0Z1D6_9ZZZZ